MKKTVINVLSIIISIGLLIFFIVTAGKIVHRNSEEASPEPEEDLTVISEDVSSKASQTVEDVITSDATSEESDSNPEQATQTNTPKPEAKFVNAPEGYFNDALFIGDSRTVGLSEYGGIAGATFFCNTGMSVYNIYKSEVEVTGIGKITFEKLMSEHSFGKIYVMLGINEIGYNRDTTIERYSELISSIKSYQPNAIIFIEANLHVTASRSASDDIINNQSIDDLNSKISAFADNVTVFYIDINTVFDSPAGSLNSDYTFDDVHILGKYYADWGSWFATKAIVK